MQTLQVVLFSFTYDHLMKPRDVYVFRIYEIILKYFIEDYWEKKKSYLASTLILPTGIIEGNWLMCIRIGNKQTNNNLERVSKHWVCTSIKT